MDIWTSRNEAGCGGFLEDIQEVGKFASKFFANICPAHFCCVAAIPKELQLWKGISLCFWNATSVNKVHVDSRDWCWTLVMPFGNCQGSMVDLPYLNSRVHACRGDMYLLHSPKVYHNVLGAEQRQSLVFTNHKSVVQRFVDVTIPDYISTLYKEFEEPL